MAEGGDDDGPSLKLIIEKGPSEGQIHMFKPRSRSEVKIGRVARGNTLSIKDEGISSKHASIRFDSPHDRPVGFWVIWDLESSNGTVLNEKVLDPFTPVALSDGDVIKIGESTSIVVRLENLRVEVKEGNVRKRIPRPKGKNLEVIDLLNESPLGKEDENKGNFRVRNTRGKATARRNEVAEVKGLNEMETASLKRVTRSTARKESGVQIEFLEAENMRRRGRPKRKENRVSDAEQIEEPNFTEDEVGGKGKGRKRNTRKDHALDISTANEYQNSDAVEMHLPIEEKKGGQNLSLSTRNSRKERNMGSLEQNVEEKPQRKRAVRGKRKNLGMETMTENDDEVAEKLNSEVEILENMKDDGLREEGEGIHGLIEEERLQTAAEGNLTMGNTSGVVKKNHDIEVDLEKMSLGEWFDFLEVYLPKQIIDETEKMILEMRQKSEKFHYFMLQKQQEKKKNVEELG